jgi:cold-inducible RNA-binding protein
MDFDAREVSCQGESMKNIYVGNLSYSATEASIRSMFETFGTVDRVNIVADRETGRAKGFGFVEMSADADADRAIAALNGQELDGRPLKINEARPKENGNGYRGKSGGGAQPMNNRWNV